MVCLICVYLKASNVIAKTFHLVNINCFNAVKWNAYFVLFKSIKFYLKAFHDGFFFGSIKVQESVKLWCQILLRL